MNYSFGAIFRLSLGKGEGRVRVHIATFAFEKTPDLDPRPFAKGRGERRRGAEHTLDERANPRRSRNVSLSEAKLQRSGQSPRGQAFNLGLIPR
jgi:hypothetical protein